MEEKMNLLSLKDLANGALQEKVDAAMQKVLENMQDPNTPWKNKRKINIKIAFVQNESRDDAAVEISVSTDTAPVSPVVTRMAIGKDLMSGKTYAQEYGRQIRGQMSLDEYSAQTGTACQQTDEESVDTETGEILSETKVIDMRKAAGS